MKENNVLRWLAVVMVMILCPLNSTLVEAAAQKVAGANIEPSRVSFTPLTSNRSLTLTVSGPDRFRFFRVFEKGEVPNFVVVRGDGSRLADGSYTHEIRTTPVFDDEAGRLVAMARQNGDKSAFDELCERGALSADPLVQSGWLRVHNGAFVLPDILRRPPSTLCMRTT